MHTNQSESCLEYWKLIDGYLISKESGNNNQLRQIIKDKYKCYKCGHTSFGHECIRIEKCTTIFFCPQCNTEWLTHSSNYPNF